MTCRSFLAVLLATSIFFGFKTASAEPLNASDPDMIGPDEYEVINAVLDKYDAFVAIERTTMTERKLDSVSIKHLTQSGVKVDDYLADDFNRKNSISYSIEKSFFKKRYFMDELQTSFPDRVKESVKISRAGFDKEKNRAIIFVMYRSISPQKAFYEEGNFVFLERKEGKWIAVKTVTASRRYY